MSTLNYFVHTKNLILEQNFGLTVSSAVVEERLVPGGARQDAGIWEGCAEEEKKGEG